MATFTAYDAVGLKEDVSDIISNISPTKTPFQTMIGNEKVHQKFFQWQEDNLRAPIINQQVEGFDSPPDDTLGPTLMRTNVTQILEKTIRVSGTMDVTTTYGRAKESAYQMAKAAQEVKRDLEVAFVGIGWQDTVGGAGPNPGPSVARISASFQAQCSQRASNNLYVAGQGIGATADYTPYTFTGGANTAFSEANLLSSLQGCYNEGAEPNTVMIVPARAITVAGFALTPAGGTNAPRIRDGGMATQVVNAVNIYKSPFGEVRFVLNRWLSGSPLSPGTQHIHTLVFEPNMWVKATLRPWFREVLAKTGDNLKQMIVGEFALKHKNWRASGVIVENVAPTAGTTNMTAVATY